MTYAQTVITDEQALLLTQAIGLALENSTAEQIGEDEEALQSLAVFFADVAANPVKYPVTGRMASTVRRIVRASKGPAQPKPVNARKARQAARQGGAKRRRQQRREQAQAWNDAVELYESEQSEMAAAMVEEQRAMRDLVFEVMGASEKGRELADKLGLTGLLEAGENVANEAETYEEGVDDAQFE